MSTSVPKLDDDPDSRTRDIALAPEDFVSGKVKLAAVEVLAVENTATFNNFEETYERVCAARGLQPTRG